jgi:hypothetical protein
MQAVFSDTFLPITPVNNQLPVFQKSDSLTSWTEGA